MSDLVNALNQQSHSSSVLDSIAHPNVVNPLAAMTGAAQAANTIYGLREKQAQQAAGEAFLNSIDPTTGQPNQALLMRNLASNPATAMAALESAQRGQNLDTTTYDLHSKRLDAVMSGGGQLIADNPSGVPAASLRAYLDQQHQLGNLTDQEYASANGQVSDDPRANSQFVLRGIGHGLAAKTALDAAKPATQLATVPQGVIPITAQPQISSSPGGGVSQGSGGVAAGAPPGDTQEYVFQPVDANGKPTGTPYKVTAPKGTVFPSMQGTQIMPAAPAATGSAGSGSGSTFPPGYTGRGAPPPPNPALANPNKPATGGSPQTAPQSPPVSTPPAGSGAPATAPPATTPPAVSAPSGGVATSLPLGTEETLNNDIKARTDASLAARDQRNTLQAGESALEALRLAKGYTGPGTSTTARMYAFLQAHDPTGALPQGDMSDTAWRQVLAKNLLRFAQASGLRGNTDMGLTEQLKGSANVEEMLPTANEEVLLKDIGRQRQAVAQTTLMPQVSANGDVVSHFKNYSSDTDPRGFAWDLYDQKTRDAIEAEAKKSGPAAVARLTKAIHDGIAAGVTKPPAAPPASASRATTTGMVQPNPLASTTDYAATSPNALAA